MKFEEVQGKQVAVEWTETSGGLLEWWHDPGVPYIWGTLGMVAQPWSSLHVGHSWNGGTTLEFLSPFLWRAPPLEMRRESRGFFPDQAGKGSLISSYEAETGLLWMWRDPLLSPEWRWVFRGTS